MLRALLPWAILTVFVALWGAPFFDRLLDSFAAVSVHVPGLDRALCMPPVVPSPTAEPAVFRFNWLSATGTGTFLAALLAGLLMGLKPREIGADLLERSTGRASP